MFSLFIAIEFIFSWRISDVTRGLVIDISFEGSIGIEEDSGMFWGGGLEGPKPRKDFAKWSDVEEKIYYFFDELFYNESKETIEYPKNVDQEEAKRVITEYKKIFDITKDQNDWFSDLKEMAVEMGYAADRKSYKKDPEAFKGMVSDVAGIVRTAY